MKDLQPPTKSGKRFCVSQQIGKVQHRKYFDTPSEARAYQIDIRAQRIMFGEHYDTVLSRTERAEVLLILKEMEEQNTSLTEVWKAYQIWNQCKAISCGDAIQKFLRRKTTQNLRKSSITTYRSILPTHLDLIEATREVTHQKLQDSIDNMEVSPRSVTKHISCLRAFFDWCQLQGFQVENPALKLIEPRADSVLPVCLDNTEVEALLRHCPPPFKNYLLIALFAGLRRGEMKRIGWDCVDTDLAQITVLGTAAKTRTRRVVSILGNAAEHLCKDYPLYPPQWRKHMRDLTLKSEVSMSRDCLRHTAATHMCNVYESIETAAMHLGNTPSVVRTHYKGVATPLATKEFYDLLA